MKKLLSLAIVTLLLFSSMSAMASTCRHENVSTSYGTQMVYQTYHDVVVTGGMVEHCIVSSYQGYSYVRCTQCGAEIGKSRYTALDRVTHSVAH